MIRRMSTLAAPLAVLAFNALAHAQEHGSEIAHAATGHEGHEIVGAIPDPKQGLYTGLTALAVFLIVLIVLSLKVWPTISKALDERASKIRNSIEEAEQAQRQAKAALAQYEQNLAAARAEAQKMLDDAKVQQQAIAAELKAKSDAELAGLRDKAKRDIDAAKSAAIAEIHSYATGMATSIAAKILKREINAQDQQRLVQESLRELQTAGRA
jgi:F-type H+-transporting ATPase subunit b